jgi:hypothetical protein
MRNRKEFLDEAIVLASAGVVSLLPDGPVARPGFVADKDPLSSKHATDMVQSIVDAASISCWPERTSIRSELPMLVTVMGQL